MPTMPSVLPLARRPSMSGRPKLRRQPWRMILSYSEARRQAQRISMKARSAVQLVSTSGVLVTTRPPARAASASMWSKPTLTVATIRRWSGTAAMSAASSLSFALMTSASARCSAAARIAASASRSRSASTASNSRRARSATASVTRRARRMRGLLMVGTPPARVQTLAISPPSTRTMEPVM
jgi:hypothetical protein